ncbi:MAG: Ig-like domain-containing protein [Spirochaetes bacterium]|nr:Ig-like domain-containing protein [Spirochaetota bacterium]
MRATEPSAEATEVATNAAVKFSFSAAMDMLSTEEAFAVSENGGKVGGKFTWDSPSNFTWRPLVPFSPGALCEAVLSTRAEDEKGNNLALASTLRFTLAGDPTPPQIVSMAPADRSAAPVPTNLLEIRFSTAMDVEGVKGALTLSPSPGQVITADAAQKCFTVVFRENLAYGTKLTVGLAAGTKARNGKGLASAYAASFWVGDDFVPPALLAATNSRGMALRDGQTAVAFEKDDSFTLSFSKAVDAPSVQGAFSLSPYLGMVWHWPSSDRAVLRPDPSFSGGSTYRFALGEGWKDLRGNRAAAGFSAYATFDGPHSAPLRVTGIADEMGRALAQNAVAPVPSWNGPVLRFSAAVKTATVVSALSLTRVSGSGSGGATLQAFVFEDGDQTVRLAIAGLAPGNVYKLVLASGSAGARDLFGNLLAEDWIFFFQT